MLPLSVKVTPKSSWIRHNTQKVSSLDDFIINSVWFFTKLLPQTWFQLSGAHNWMVWCQKVQVQTGLCTWNIFEKPFVNNYRMMCPGFSSARCSPPQPVWPYALCHGSLGPYPVAITSTIVLSTENLLSMVGQTLSTRVLNFLRIFIL